MSAHPSEEQLSAFLDQELPGRGPPAIEEHLVRPAMLARHIWRSWPRSTKLRGRCRSRSRPGTSTTSRPGSAPASGNARRAGRCPSGPGRRRRPCCWPWSRRSRCASARRRRRRPRPCRTKHRRGRSRSSRPRQRPSRRRRLREPERRRKGRTGISRTLGDAARSRPNARIASSGAIGPPGAHSSSSRVSPRTRPSRPREPSRAAPSTAPPARLEEQSAERLKSLGYGAPPPSGQRPHGPRSQQQYAPPPPPAAPAAADDELAAASPPVAEGAVDALRDADVPKEKDDRSALREAFQGTRAGSGGGGRIGGGDEAGRDHLAEAVGARPDRQRSAAAARGLPEDGRPASRRRLGGRGARAVRSRKACARTGWTAARGPRDRGARRAGLPGPARRAPGAAGTSAAAVLEAP